MQIVAPAGNFEALRASINGGADAVYLGMPLFGARAKAQNFDGEELKKAIEYSHLLGVKVFVTLNTLIKDSEMELALETARYAEEVGADAAIVQDIRFIKKLKTKLPEFTLHASTQMGIHNADGAKVLLDMGIRRAVLARETLPNDIAEIKKTGIEIEFFAQGALCICFSGNCYFSSLASSYSGNRGKCMQLCRKPYIFNGKSGYHISAKDICLYDKLNELEKLGVDAIKIEGRMRSEEYAYRTVGIYSGANVPEDPIYELKNVFNRGDYCQAYLNDNAPFNIVYPYVQGNIGVPVGNIDKVKGKAVFVNGYSPHNGDGFKILRDKKEICGAYVQNGVIYSEKVCAIGDELRRTVSGELKERQPSIKRVAVDVQVTVNADEYPSVVLNAPTAHTLVTGNIQAETAKTRALSENDMIRVFNKVGDIPVMPKITVVTDGKAFMPVSALNELRRESYSALISECNKVKRNVSVYKGLNYTRFEGSGKILMIDRADRLNAEIMSKIDWLALNPADYSDFEIPKTDLPVLLNLPITMRGKDKEIIISAINRKGIYGVISNNLYSLGLTDKPILLGIGHNIIGETDLPHILSVEADRYTENGFLYAFGYAPVMTFCHCPYGKCINCTGKDELTDEKGRVFHLRRYKTGHCYWQMLNCVPHYSDLRSAINRKYNLFFDCTDVARNDILKVLNSEYNGAFTRGNINKGLK